MNPHHPPAPDPHRDKGPQDGCHQPPLPPGPPSSIPRSPWSSFTPPPFRSPCARPCHRAPIGPRPPPHAPADAPVARAVFTLAAGAPPPRPPPGGQGAPGGHPGGRQRQPLSPHMQQQRTPDLPQLGAGPCATQCRQLVHQAIGYGAPAGSHRGSLRSRGAGRTGLALGPSVAHSAVITVAILIVFAAFLRPRLPLCPDDAFQLSPGSLQVGRPGASQKQVQAARPICQNSLPDLNGSREDDQRRKSEPGLIRGCGEAGPQ